MENLEIGFALDRRWHSLRGEMETSKKPSLLALARVLQSVQVPYAIIGGIAAQVHREEPRTTLDIDLAVPKRDLIPREQLAAAGFVETGRHAHSDNWLGPGETPVQFTDDPPLAEAIARAITIDLDGVPLRVLSAADLLHAKLRAAGDPGRRRSKRLQDLADAEALLERHPDLRALLDAQERSLLEKLEV